jgi:hypothetical protein
VLVGNPQVLTPLCYVSKPIGGGVWIQPAIWRDAVNNDGCIPENAKKKLVILGIESVDVVVD